MVWKKLKNLWIMIIISSSMSGSISMEHNTINSSFKLQTKIPSLKKMLLLSIPFLQKASSGQIKCINENKHFYVPTNTITFNDLMGRLNNTLGEYNLVIPTAKTKASGDCYVDITPTIDNFGNFCSDSDNWKSLCVEYDKTYQYRMKDNNCFESIPLEKFKKTEWFYNIEDLDLSGKDCPSVKNICVSSFYDNFQVDLSKNTDNKNIDCNIINRKSSRPFEVVKIKRNKRSNATETLRHIFKSNSLNAFEAIYDNKTQKVSMNTHLFPGVITISNDDIDCEIDHQARSNWINSRQSRNLAIIQEEAYRPSNNNTRFLQGNTAATAFRFINISEGRARAKHYLKPIAARIIKPSKLKSSKVLLMDQNSSIDSLFQGTAVNELKRYKNIYFNLKNMYNNNLKSKLITANGLSDLMFNYYKMLFISDYVKHQLNLSDDQLNLYSYNIFFQDYTGKDILWKRQHLLNSIMGTTSDYKFPASGFVTVPKINFNISVEDLSYLVNNLALLLDSKILINDIIIKNFDIKGFEKHRINYSEIVSCEAGTSCQNIIDATINQDMNFLSNPLFNNLKKLLFKKNDLVVSQQYFIDQSFYYLKSYLYNKFYNHNVNVIDITKEDLTNYFQDRILNTFGNSPLNLVIINDFNKFHSSLKLPFYFNARLKYDDVKNIRRMLEFNNNDDNRMLTVAMPTGSAKFSTYLNLEDDSIDSADTIVPTNNLITIIFANKPIKPININEINSILINLYRTYPNLLLNELNLPINNPGFQFYLQSIESNMMKILKTFVNMNIVDYNNQFDSEIYSLKKIQKPLKSLLKGTCSYKQDNNILTVRVDYSVKGLMELLVCKLNNVESKETLNMLNVISSAWYNEDLDDGLKDNYKQNQLLNIINQLNNIDIKNFRLYGKTVLNNFLVTIEKKLIKDMFILGNDLSTQINQLLNDLYELRMCMNSNVCDYSKDIRYNVENLTKTKNRPLSRSLNSVDIDVNFNDDEETFVDILEKKWDDLVDYFDNKFDDNVNGRNLQAQENLIINETITVKVRNDQPLTQSREFIALLSNDTNTDENRINTAISNPRKIEVGSTKKVLYSNDTIDLELNMNDTVIKTGTRIDCYDDNKNNCEKTNQVIIKKNNRLHSLSDFNDIDFDSCFGFHNGEIENIYKISFVNLLIFNWCKWFLFLPMFIVLVVRKCCIKTKTSFDKTANLYFNKAMLSFATATLIANSLGLSVSDRLNMFCDYDVQRFSRNLWITNVVIDGLLALKSLLIKNENVGIGSNTIHALLGFISFCLNMPLIVVSAQAGYDLDTW